MPETSKPKSKPTRAWYLVPLLLSIIGGIIGYFAVKNDDKPMANRLLIIGVVMFVLALSAAFVIPALMIGSIITPYNPSMPTGSQSPEQIIMTTYNFPVGGPFVVTLRNVGATSVNLADAQYFINGVAATNISVASCSSSSVSPGDACVVTLTVSTTNLTDGSPYVFKVATPTGRIFQYTVFYGITGCTTADCGV